MGVGLACLFLADMEISTLNPWLELRYMGLGALTPDFTVLWEFRLALLNTLVFAFCGIFLGIVGGAVLVFFFRHRSIRLFCTFIRSIHEIFWAFLFMPMVGLNPICGVLAIGIPYAGIFAKVYAEILQEADQHPLRGLPPGTSGISCFFYAVLPSIYPDVKYYTYYRFECALRSSAILGFIGLPTLGYHLETSFREGLYSEAAALLYCFFLLIASLKYWLKPRWTPLFVIAAFFLVSKQVHFSWENVTRFLTHDILPWPIRRQGFLDGSHQLAFPLNDLGQWVLRLLEEEAWPGFLATLTLTQVSLMMTGVIALATFPSIGRHFHGSLSRRSSHFILIILRTTPEYIIAYILIQWWGPSMLPALAAIALHNGAILAYLTGRNANLIQLRSDAPIRRLDRYFFEIIPRVYGQFLAFLFYRWEIIMRESAILGVLGIYTLGFYVDSAIADDKMDKALFLILITALVNMSIDKISRMVRRKLEISSKLTISQGKTW